MDPISHFRDDVTRLGELGCILQGHRASQVHGWILTQASLCPNHPGQGGHLTGDPGIWTQPRLHAVVWTKSTYLLIDSPSIDQVACECWGWSTEQ